MINFFEIIFFYCCCERTLIWRKNIKGFLDDLFEYYFFNIAVNVHFFIDLKFEYYCECYPEVLLEVSL